MEISIKITSNDALMIDADILVLKHAQALYGVDLQVADRLSKFHSNLISSLPEYGKFLLVDTYGTLGVKEVLFVGTEKVFQFRYQNIREFAFRALTHLAEVLPQIETVCFTLHGAGYGLDETEAFRAEIAGIVDALSQGKFPHDLKQILIVEIDRDRAAQLDRALKKLFPKGVVIISKGNLAEMNPSSSNLLKDAGYTSETKPFVFVAMPFDKKMYDVFHFGIKGAISKAGYLCERADEDFFTGDIMERVKMRIKQSNIVVADLTQANANVYLEVGYAWGCGKQTILLVQDDKELKFDVRSQRCIVYSSIKELEELLQKELENIPLKAKLATKAG